MKLMSFNTQHCLNYITKEIDFDLMAETIKNCGADIIGLNEMRGEGPDPTYTDQVPMLSKLTGIPNFYFAEAIKVYGANPYGNGILSKYPILSAQTIMVPDPEVRAYNGFYETRCLLKARLENGLTVMTIHIGLNPDEQANAINTILEHLEDKKCILMGDFNMHPDNELLHPIRERMKDAADLFSSPLLSCPSDKPVEKIDYIFVSPDIEIVDADIPAIIASDHRPHLATVNLPKE